MDDAKPRWHTQNPVGEEVLQEFSATTEWCENNYEVSPFIAEFWNTMSNIPFIALAVLGLHLSWKYKAPKRFLVLYGFVMTIGLGSAAFHATLEYGPQLMDELPMVWTILTWFYVLYEPLLARTPGVSTTLARVLVLTGVALSVAHSTGGYVIAFQLAFSAFNFGCLGRFVQVFRSSKNEEIKKLGSAAISCLVIATSCWMADRYLCEGMQTMPVNPQGHAWWHLFMAFNAYIGPAVMQFVYYERDKRAPVLKYLFGFVPYVVPTKDSAEDDSQYWDPTAQFLGRVEFGKFNKGSQGTPSIPGHKAFGVVGRWTLVSHAADRAFPPPHSV